MISSFKLSHSSSSPPFQTQKKVGSSLFQSLPTKALKFPATLVSTSRRSADHTTTTAFFFNNQKQHQDSQKPGKCFSDPLLDHIIYIHKFQ